MLRRDISGLQRTGFFFFVLLFLFVAGKVECLAAGQTTDETQRIASVIKKVVEAYGGKEKIEGMRSLHAKGKIEAFMLQDQGTYELYFKRGGKLLVETKYAHSTEKRILNGDRGYRSTDKLPLEEVTGPRYFAMLYQYKHLDLLYNLLKGTYQIHSAGTSSVSGLDAEVFALRDREGTVMDIYIDGRDFLIKKVTGHFSAGTKKIDLSVEFSDFKKVEGMVFPFRITNFAGGQKIAQTVMETYSPNQEIPDSLFELPAVPQSL